MQRTSRFAIAMLLCLPACLSGVARAADLGRGLVEPPVVAAIDTTLGTASGQIRQFAFDGDAETYFASEKNPGSSDHFTLVFDRPVAVKSILVTTGKPSGGDTLDAGILEVSGDGKAFEQVARFADGVARTKLPGRKIQ